MNAIEDVEAARLGDMAAEGYRGSKRQELREAVYRARAAGVTFQALSDAAGVSMMTVRKWVEEGETNENDQ